MVDGTMSISYASTQYDVAASMFLMTQNRYSSHSDRFSTQAAVPHRQGALTRAHLGVPQKKRGNHEAVQCRPEWVSEAQLQV